MANVELLSSSKDALDIITFVLAVVGALGSALFFLRGRQLRLDVEASAAPPFEQIDVHISNPGERRVTVRKAELCYGMSADHSDHLAEVVSLKGRAFDGGDANPGQISIADLRRAVAERGIDQKSFSRLWFVVTGHSRKTWSTMVEIDPAIITGAHVRQAAIYIAADLILGFPQRASRPHDHWKIK